MTLCDTNVISELGRRQPNPGVLVWADTITQLQISAMTVEELWYGLSRKPNPKLASWIDSFLQIRCEILPITEQIAHRAGQLRGDFARRGVARSQPDMLIAATAQVHQLTLITRNTRDFEDCAISLLNPFS